MRELRWIDSITLTGQPVWELRGVIEQRQGENRNAVDGGVQKISHGHWIAYIDQYLIPHHKGDLESYFPDAESAMRAVEDELIRRCKADLLALEDLRGE